MSEEKNNIPIEFLGLSKRSYNCLKGYNVDTVDELLELSREELLNIRNLGQTSLAEIENTIQKTNLEEMFPVKTFKDYVAATDRTKVLHHIDERTVFSEINDVIFYDRNGFLREDIEIDEMQLSIRATGALIRNGYKTAKQVVYADLKDIANLNQMGETSLKDIINRLKQITFVLFKKGEKDQLIEKSAAIICTDIKNSCPEINKSFYTGQVQSIVYENEDFIASDELLKNKKLMNELYLNPILFNVFKNHICSILFESSFLTIDSLKKRIPIGLQNSDVFMGIIKDLIATRKIKYKENGFQYHFLTISDHIELMEEGNNKIALICRLQGMTLEETGSVLGVTRERARQLTKKALEKMPKLWEDNFKYWFENYDITKEEFKNIFMLTDESYGYLKGTCKKGEKPLEEMLRDAKLTGIMAQKIDLEMRKYCVVIAGEYIPIKRECLIKKLLEFNYSDKDCLISDFFELYLNFLRMHNLDINKELLFPTERAFESNLERQRYVLLKYGRKIRYYNMDEYDLDGLFLELKFELYEKQEISTFKLFKLHKELMNEYNILDEYELHNLMKKNEDMLMQYNVTLSRMPFILIGAADRDRQVIELLYKTAPIDFFSFCDAYEEEYGVKSETVGANFLKCINKYYEDGTFSVDYIVMSSDEYQFLGSQLTEDIYFIEDVQKIYKSIFPNGNFEKINPYNLKALGFKVYVDYIIRSSYLSADDYFTKLLTKQDFIDLNKLDKRISYNQAFHVALERLRINFDILEIERNKYMTFDRLLMDIPDLTKEKLLQFVTAASNFDQEDFFTIKSIRRKGFANELLDIGFSDWFFGALLRSNKTIRYIKVGGAFLFGRFDKQIKVTDFLIFLMKKTRKINLIQFTKNLEEVYGIKYDKSKLISIFYQTGIYYDSSVAEIYLDKETYYKNI